MDHWTEILVVSIWAFVSLWQMVYFAPPAYSKHDMLMVFGPCLLSGGLLVYSVHPDRLRSRILDAIGEYGHGGTLAGFDKYVRGGMWSYDKYTPKSK